MKKSAQLSQDQLKKSISAKQSKAKLKNVLAQPCPVFWPLLPNSSCGTFRSILRATLPEASTGSATKALINDGKSIICGLTCVYRNLKEGKVDSLILSASIQPTFVTQQIIQQALTVRRDLRVICIENLEDILKDVFGLTSTAVGLINQSNANAFSQLHSFIEKEFDKFPIPDGFLHHNLHDAVVEQKVHRQKSKSLLEPTFDPSSLYLHKKLYGKERAFVPQQEEIQRRSSAYTIAVSGMKSSTIVTKSLTNLSISSKDIRKNKKKQGKTLKKKTPYLPMVINRIHPNPSSKKRAKKAKKKQ